MSLPRVLVADDQPDVLLALRLLLKGEGFETETADSPAAILAALGRRRFDALLMDLNYTRDTTSGAEGLDLLPRLKALKADLPIVVMTAWGTIGLAVEAMRRGAADFVLKPWDNDRLVETLRGQLAGRSGEAARRPAHDLAIAHRVQARLLPQTRPPLATLDYVGRCVQAGAVGGDGYDFLDLGPGRVALLLADASGKGISAALLMANLQASLRSEASRLPGDLTGMLRSVNALFLASTAPEHFATLFIGGYEDATRRLRYANCGHNPPLLLRADGGTERLTPTAPVLGLIADWRGEAGEVTLAPGDVLLLFSDGATEARNREGEEFGEARLLEAVRASRDLPADEIPGAILAVIEAFAGSDHEDDITLVAARAR